MNYLEARRILREFSGGEVKPLRVMMSGEFKPLSVYFKAWATRHDIALKPTAPSFGTLRQAMLTPAADDEIYLLMPWDLCVPCDWRSGMNGVKAHFDGIGDAAEEMLYQVDSRNPAAVFYLDAPIPPLFSRADTNAQVAATLKSMAAGIGARILSPDAFSLSSYLQHGCPIASSQLGSVAERIVAAAFDTGEPVRKVLATDLDETMWRGVIGEDGLDGIDCGPEGPGYPHYLYQSFLKKLVAEGVIVVAVSRNDPDLAEQPFVEDRTLLKRDEIVQIAAAYAPKSELISSLAASLDLGTSAFVFVDDNPVECAEVSSSLPDIDVLHFPKTEDELPAFFDRLSVLFSREAVTDEDRQRTARYRQREATSFDATGPGANLDEFLAGLNMTLIVRDRSEGDRTRAEQLINKTNQFNINGLRKSPEDIAKTLAGGGRLYTAELTDISGSHGEIISCLVDASGTIESFVLSCRVFQRRVEHAFLDWLRDTLDGPLRFRAIATERNTPSRDFFESWTGFPDDGLIEFDTDLFEAATKDLAKVVAIDDNAETAAARAAS